MSILVQRASDVRITETDLSQIITSASSSVGCIVMVSKQGSPTPKHFTNGDDFLAEYGNPDAKVSFSHYCAIDFFKKGNDLWAVRALGEDYATSGVLMYMDGDTVKLKGVAIPDPTNVDWAALDKRIAKPMAVFYPNKGPGSYGNRYAIGIQSNTPEAFTVSQISVETQNSGGNLPASTYSYVVSKVMQGGLESLASSNIEVVIAAGSDQNAVTLTWEADDLAIGYRIYGRVGDDLGLIEEVGSSVLSYTDTGDIIPDETINPKVDASEIKGSLKTTFTVRIYDLSYNTSVPVEEFNCSLGDNTDSSGYATELTERINPYSQYVNVTSNMLAYDDDEIPAIPTIEKVQMTGGDSGTAPTSYDVINAWKQFSNKQLYAVNLLINGGFSEVNVQKAMISLAESRGDCVALLDVPSANQRWQSAIDYRNLQLNANSNYASLFCPDVYESDTINGKDLFVPFSGWAAALCAYTDSIADPSVSPAGLNRGLLTDVLATRYTYDDSQASNLYKAQVNYTRTFVGSGIALWEQLTLQSTQSALSWLCVRRIINVIKVSLYNGLIPYLQERNDDFTARAIKAVCDEYLGQLRAARAISDFTVSTKTTAAEINSGIRKVTVVIIPMIPIHEIQLNVVISKQGATFEEVLSQVGG